MFVIIRVIILHVFLISGKIRKHQRIAAIYVLTHPVHRLFDDVEGEAVMRIVEHTEQAVETYEMI